MQVRKYTSPMLYAVLLPQFTYFIAVTSYSLPNGREIIA